MLGKVYWQVTKAFHETADSNLGTYGRCVTWYCIWII